LDTFELIIEEKALLKKFDSYIVQIEDGLITVAENLPVDENLFIRSYVAAYQTIMSPVDIPLLVLVCGDEEVTPESSNPIVIDYFYDDDTPDVQIYSEAKVSEQLITSFPACTLNEFKLVADTTGSLLSAGGIADIIVYDTDLD